MRVKVKVLVYNDAFWIHHLMHNFQYILQQMYWNMCVVFIILVYCFQFLSNFTKLSLDLHLSRQCKMCYTLLPTMRARSKHLVTAKTYQITYRSWCPL